METSCKSVFPKRYGWFTRFHVKSKYRKDAGNLWETTKAQEKATKMLKKQQSKQSEIINDQEIGIIHNEST